MCGVLARLWSLTSNESTGDGNLPTRLEFIIVMIMWQEYRELYPTVVVKIRCGHEYRGKRQISTTCQLDHKPSTP